MRCVNVLSLVEPATISILETQVNSRPHLEHLYFVPLVWDEDLARKSYLP